MMRLLIFAKRNVKELLRDPLSLIFCIGLPAVLLILISIMQKSVEVDIFELSNFTPGMLVFSLSFLSLFSAMLVSNDRINSFLIRLFVSPMKAKDFILGYSLPLLLIAIIQCIVCLIIACFMGLTFNVNLILSFVFMIPIACLFIGFGLLIGSLFKDKQVGGISSILVNVVAFTSGMWFDLNLMGGAFKIVSSLLPFYHANELIKLIMAGNYNNIFIHLLWVIGYAIVVFVIAIITFNKKMISDK